MGTAVEFENAVAAELAANQIPTTGDRLSYSNIFLRDSLVFVPPNLVLMFHFLVLTRQVGLMGMTLISFYLTRLTLRRMTVPLSMAPVGM
jgi:hypothetical protein